MRRSPTDSGSVSCGVEATSDPVNQTVRRQPHSETSVWGGVPSHPPVLSSGKCLRPSLPSVSNAERHTSDPPLVAASRRTCDAWPGMSPAEALRVFDPPSVEQMCNEIVHPVDPDFAKLVDLITDILISGLPVTSAPASPDWKTDGCNCVICEEFSKLYDPRVAVADRQERWKQIETAARLVGWQCPTHPCRSEHQACFEQMNGKQGSFTGTDDHAAYVRVRRIIDSLLPSITRDDVITALRSQREISAEVLSSHLAHGPQFQDYIYSPVPLAPLIAEQHSDPPTPIPSPLLTYVADHPVVTQINGAQGEWTGLDDMPPRAKSKTRKRTPAQRAVRNGQLAMQKQILASKLTKDEIKSKMPLGQLIRGRGAYAVTRPKLKGKGGYVSDMAGKVGSWAGGALAKWLGGIAEKYFPSLSGMGDYRELPAKMSTPIASNTLLGLTTPDAQQIPSMHRTSEGTRVTRREYLGKIDMTAQYKCLTRKITPSNPNVFPWLSRMAPLYSRWLPLGIVFELKSLTPMTSSGTASMGAMGMSAGYDVYAPSPASMDQALNSTFAVSDKPSNSMLFPIECDPKETASEPFFIQAPGLISPPDKHLYEMANLNIVTEGAASDYSAAAQLWITYDMLLLQPVQPSAAAFTGYSHIPLDYSDQKAPFTLFDSPDGFFDTVGVVSISNDPEPTIVFSKDLLPGTELVFVWFGYSDDVETAMAPIVADTVSGGLGLGGDLFTTTVPEDRAFLYSADQASSAGTAVAAYTLVYDGTGTDLFPPTIKFTAGTCAHPQGGDIIIFSNPPGYTDDDGEHLEWMCNLRASRRDRKSVV